MFHHRRVLERHLDISAESPAVTGIPLSCLRHLPRVARVNSLGRAIKSQDRRASLNSPLKCSPLPSRNSFVPSHRRMKHGDRRDVHRFLGSVSRRKLGERPVCSHISLSAYFPYFRPNLKRRLRACLGGKLGSKIESQASYSSVHFVQGRVAA